MHRLIAASFFSFILAYLTTSVAHANLVYTDQQKLHLIVKDILAKKY
jgi:hypothetical protein